MPNNRTISFTSEFKKRLKALSKKYKKIKSDLTPFLGKLESGELLGSQIKGIDQKVFKVRIPNTSAGKGKSGGFRLLYYLKLSDEIILLTIYSKNMQLDITNDELAAIITNYNGNVS